MALSKTVVQQERLRGLVIPKNAFPPLTDQELDDIRYPAKAAAVAARRYPEGVRHSKAAKLQRSKDLATWMRVCSRPVMEPTGYDPKTGRPLFQDEQGRNTMVPIEGDFVLNRKSLCRLYEEHAPHALPAEYFNPKTRKQAIANVTFSVGVVISSPGIVTVATDLEFSPSNPNTTAILIQNITSNRGVWLRGNGFALSQGGGSNKKTGVAAIGINASTNVTISDFRSICDFSLVGIITSRTATGTTKDLKIQNCTILNNGPPYTGPTNPPAASLVSGGILLSDVQGAIITNVIAEENAGFAIGVNAVTGLRATNSRFDRSRSLAGTFPFGSLASGCFGFIWPFTPPFLQAAFDVVFENCTFSHHNGDDTVIGLTISSEPTLQGGVAPGGYGRVTKCEFINNVQSNPNPSMPGFLTGTASGLSIYAVGGTFEDCSIINQSNVAVVGFENQGLQSISTNITFRRCRVSGIVGSSFIESACGMGIDVLGVGCLLEDCEVDNIVNSVASLGQPESSCGFFISQVIYHDYLQQSRSITVKNCTASNIPDGPGFWTSGVIGGVTKNCISVGSKGGFLVADVYTDKAITRNLLFSSNIAENNSSYGFKEILAGEGEFFDNLYESNWAHQNGVAQSGGAYDNNYVFAAQIPDISVVYGQTFTDSYPKNFSSSIPTSLPRGIGGGALSTLRLAAPVSTSTAIVKREAKQTEEEKLMLLIAEHKSLVELETSTKKSLEDLELKKRQLATTLREQLLAHAELLKN